MNVVRGGQESCDSVPFDKSIIFFSMKSSLHIVTSRFDTALMEKNKVSKLKINHKYIFRSHILT
jgi:hypothetical protein